MKKILIIATVDSHIKTFHQDFIKKLVNLGWQVDTISNGDACVEGINTKYDIDISRSPFKLKNLKAISKIRRIIDENKYDIVHSHTPIGGVLARLANKRKSTLKVYTAHGFHFYKGAPLINWLIYYPIEKILSKRTDVLLTINNEDYKIAMRKFKASNIYQINGVGIKFDKFDYIDKHPKVEFENGLSGEDFTLTSIGELNDNKNQIFTIKSLIPHFKKYKNLKYYIIGSGRNKDKIIKLIKKFKLENSVFLLGYRKDIPFLLSKTNVLLSSSIREGLAVNVIEAMRMKCIILVSDIRGHNDLISDNVNGFIYQSQSRKSFQSKFTYIMENYNKLNFIQNNAFESTSAYDVDLINNKILDIYMKELEKKV